MAVTHTALHIPAVARSPSADHPLPAGSASLRRSLPNKSRFIPHHRQVSSRLGTSHSEADVNSFSPFTERLSSKRRAGGLKGDGKTSSAETDPLLRSLNERAIPSLSQPRSPAQVFSPDPSFDIHQPQNLSDSEKTQGTPPTSQVQEQEPTLVKDKDAENDISLRLPELRELLGFLREARGAQGDEVKGTLGKVFLVGTGPGDADLLTVKAWRLLQSADLVLYDRLVSRDVLDLVHPGARLLYVGKSAGYHSRTQEEIHELLLSFAEAGASVVRLKGGDPLVFGRGGEEVEYLQQHGIQVDIVPGITSASGIGASLGIPLTHRGLANSVRFLTGHSRKGGEDPLHVAASAADPDSTLVIYMGLATLPGLVQRLVSNGLPDDTPAVAVERGTTKWQRNVFATLEDLPQEVSAAALVSPTLVIIGQVVALSPLWPFQERSSNSLLRAGTDKKNQLCAKGSEPRDRQLRGPDPCLPSQRH